MLRAQARSEPSLREVVLRRDLRVRNPLKEAVLLLPENVEIASDRSVLHARPGDFKDAVADFPGLAVIRLAILPAPQRHREPEAFDKQSVNGLFEEVRRDFLEGDKRSPLQPGPPGKCSERHPPDVVVVQALRPEPASDLHARQDVLRLAPGRLHALGAHAAVDVDEPLLRLDRFDFNVAPVP